MPDPKPPRLFLMAPAFAVPLSSDELMILGYIGLVWGQIDFLADQILAFAYKFDKAQRDRFLTDKMMATKADMLAKDYDRLPAELHDDTKRFVELIQETKQARNGCFHGVWGWQWLRRSKTRRVAAWHHRMLTNPVVPAQLEPLAKKLEECSLIGQRVTEKLYGFPPGPHAQFTWGGGANGSDGPPPWLAKSGVRFQKGRSPTDRTPAKRRTQPKVGPAKGGPPRPLKD